eukprot:2489091-Amphidinium_carterae.1
MDFGNDNFGWVATDANWDVFLVATGCLTAKPKAQQMKTKYQPTQNGGLKANPEATNKNVNTSELQFAGKPKTQPLRKRTTKESQSH